ncbi:uncharacterized protein LOC143648382 isoform X2 [Tamandua tetradactyla]|uniref:uncharacterized protein LOC143648382 isoform X2 n=1 Tax=Tamandua tetradactyla TaxID=48850 RepID=UPI004054746D
MMLLLKSSSKKYKYRNLGLLLLSSIKLVKLSKVLVHTRHTDGKQDRKIILSNSSVSLRTAKLCACALNLSIHSLKQAETESTHSIRRPSTEILQRLSEASCFLTALSWHNALNFIPANNMFKS